jgi:hypothetical protein
MKRKQFAKIFETPFTQVVLMIGRDDETDMPKVWRWLDVDDVRIGVHLEWERDDDPSWDAAEEAFDSFTQKDAQALADACQDQLLNSKEEK